MKLLKKGSVKDIYELDDKDLLFSFSDRYSIFDWGEMPDQIPFKGESLARMGETFLTLLESPSFWRDYFEKNPSESELAKNLRERGVKTHFIGPREKEKFRVNSVAVHPPSFDSEKKVWAYPNLKKEEKREWSLLPLEVIFRLGLPPGSSFLTRKHSRPYLNFLGLDEFPSQGEFFKNPIIEFSTKLESRDSLLIDPQEILSLSCLTWEELEEFGELQKTIARALSYFLEGSPVPLTLWDGKLEWASRIDSHGKREFMLVDTLGIDEMRLSYNGVELSKEILRRYYASSLWAKKLNDVKKNLGREEYNLRSLVAATPEKLKTEFLEWVSELYQKLADLFQAKSEGLAFNETSFAELTLKIEKGIPK